MAKKKSGTFVMSKEILNIVRDDPGIKGREAIALLQKKFPKEEINEKSAAVAFSNARKALGIGKSNLQGGKNTLQSSRSSNDVAVLKAAREFVSSMGSTKSAIAAIQQLEELQL